MTCLADMYWFSNATARAAVETGMRAIIGMTITAFPIAYASGTDEHNEKKH